MRKIVLTGGPCAGKTTALSKIFNYFTDRGVDVYLLPEAATLYSQAGVNFLSANANYFRQAELSLMQFQMHMEDSIASIAALSDRQVLLVCDRGTMDIKAYVEESFWRGMVNDLGHSEVSLRDARYDAVIHMLTAAKGAEKFYTLDNNTSRTETIEQARAIDDKLIQAWTGHPHLRIIPNDGSFDTKIRKTIEAIGEVVGIPVCIEKERKYLVELTGEVIGGVENQIFQTYLQSAAGEEARVRRRGNGHDWVYFYTHKVTGNREERIETERQISQEEFNHLMQFADEQRNTIQKTRTCFVHEHVYFELDTFISPSPGLQLLEIEGNYQSETIPFPPFLKVLEDVTGNEKYYNHYIARKEKGG